MKKELRTSPKDVFLHLLMMVMLYLGVISLISLSFAYVDYSFPDQLSFYRVGVLNNIRFHSSMLVVSFPLFLFLSGLVQRDFRKTPEKHNLKFSKWLVYLTLFVAAITIVIDLIQLVNRFYSGELTTPFLLKILSVLVVAGAVFGYYIWDVQSEPQQSQVPRAVAWGSSFVVVIMLILGFVIAGSPSEQRAVRMDEQRVNDLGTIQSELVNYWRLKEALPDELSALEDDIRGFKVPLDPETDEAYEYRVIEPLRFELCATFNFKSTDTETKEGRPITYSPDYPMAAQDNWGHEAGHHCYERSIDPDLYPKP